MKRALACSLLLAASITPLASAAVTRFEKLDKNHSTVGFRVPILGGLSEVWGKFTEFSAVVVWDDADPTKSSVEATIDVASIDTGIAMRDDDLRSDNFFEVVNYPQIVFRSTAVERRPSGLVALGTLTMHGETRPIELPFEIVGVDEDSETKKIALGIRASTTLDRDEFGIDWRHDLPPFVGDLVTVEIRLLTRLTARGAGDPATPAP